VLINKNGNVMNIAFDAKAHTLIDLKEVLEPMCISSGNLFNMGERARIIDKR